MMRSLYLSLLLLVSTLATSALSAAELPRKNKAAEKYNVPVEAMHAMAHETTAPQDAPAIADPLSKLHVVIRLSRNNDTE